MITMAQFGMGAVIAAAIAGAFSIIGLIVAKEHKVSEFRREWLEDLRGEIARFIAHANLFANVMTYSTVERDVVADFRAELIAMSEAATRIRLKLDETDAQTAPMLRDMASIEGHVRAGDAGSAGEISKREAQLVQHSRVLLRREWRRVRAGESVYRFTKGSAAVVTCLAVVALLFFLFSPR